MKKLRNIHPGEILKEEFLAPMELSAYRLSVSTGLSQTRISQIIKGERGISAETALKLGKFFDVSAQFWMNLQSSYDLEEAELKHSKEIKTINTVKELGFV